MKRLALALAFAAVLAFGQADAQVPGGGTTFPGVQITAVATGTTAGTTATLAAALGKVTYICGFSVSPGSATAAITITITTTGLTNNYSANVGAPVTAVGVTGLKQTENFNPCLPANAPNTGIAVVAGALGAGGVNQAVTAWGYQR